MLTAAAAHPTPADPADSQAEDAQYYRAALHELIDMGMDLARGVHGQATGRAGGAKQAEGPGVVSAPDAAMAFDRISRAVRRTVAMARHVAQPLPTRAAAPRPEQERAAARRQVIRAVEDALQREAGDERGEALHAELYERLDAPELDDEIGTRPVAEIIADICRDLGLGRFLGTHPWKRRRPEDVRDLCARAARPTGAGPLPAPSGPAQGWGETWRPQPYTEELAIELMHKLLETRPPRIRGP